MFIHQTCLSVLGFTGALLASNVKGDVINLTQDATVRSVATYSYYSRAATPFSTLFYPGPPHGDGGMPASYKDGSLTDTAFSGGGGAPVALSSGDLTNTGSGANVAGWRGVVGSDGKFDILIDLGARYNIASVTIDYSDFSGFRWDTGANAQAVYVAASLAGATPQESDFSPFATQTFTSGSTSASKFATFDGADVNARYILFRGDVSAAGTGSNGGVLNEVTIMGSTIPEPGSMALVLTAAPLILSRGRSTAAQK